MDFFSGFFVFLSCALCSGHGNTNFRNKFPLSETLQKQFAQEEGIDCEDDDQCQYFIRGSKCVDKRCRCPDGLLLSSDGSKCLGAAEGFGSPCEDNVQCSQALYAGGVCDNNLCACKSGYHYLKGSCWMSSDLREKCIRSEQCFSAYEYIGLACDSGVCKCRTNYYEKSNSGCRRERRTGESCNIDKDCIDGSTCDKLKCSREEQSSNPNESFLIHSNTTSGTAKSGSNCPKGKFNMNGTCVLELGMNCRNDSECDHIPKAQCLDGTVCGCEPATYIASDSNTQCIRVARGKTEDIKSTSCKRDRECSVFGGNSFCQNRRCACNNESYWEKENFVCWPLKKLGESCNSIIDCHPSLSKADCVENVCACTAGFHPKDSLCVPDAVKVGDACENDDECLFSNSYCESSSVCACREHYYAEKGKCVPGVGTECTSQDDCAHLKNTVCGRGKEPEKQCLCLEHHCRSPEYKYCLPIKNFTENCSETFQCTPLLGDYGECRDNACQCVPQSHYSYKKCSKSKFIGERCTSLADCFPGSDADSVICLNEHCSCNYGYEHSGNGLCAKTNSGSVIERFSTLIVFGVVFAALVG